MESALACLVGTFLGFRFGVLILVPITVTALGGFMVFNGLAGRAILADFGHFAILIASNQAGYFVGLTGRDVVTGLFQRLVDGQTRRV